VFFPHYSEDILHLQYKTIECLNEDIIFKLNAKKRKRFNLFVENLIVKNNELLEKIKQIEEEDNNIHNYEKIEENGVSDSAEEEDAPDDETIQENVQESGEETVQETSHCKED
jgi:hypothetical protein